MRHVTTTAEPLLVTVADAAAMLAVSTVTIRRMLREGLLPKVQIAKAVRIPQAAIVALAAPSVRVIGKIASSVDEDEAAPS